MHHFGADLEKLSLDTVKMFAKDVAIAGLLFSPQ
jgi:hypothetical protein